MFFAFPVLLQKFVYVVLKGMRPVFRRLTNGELALGYSETAKKLKSSLDKSKDEQSAGNCQPRSRKSLTPDEVSLLNRLLTSKSVISMQLPEWNNL